LQIYHHEQVHQFGWKSSRQGNITNLSTFIIKFYRIIANEIKSNPRSILSPPALPLIENATHTNSELIALLLMVYPQIEDKIYIHYNLKPNKKGESYK